jgi:hypothetical protein
MERRAGIIAPHHRSDDETIEVSGNGREMLQLPRSHRGDISLGMKQSMPSYRS